MDGAVLTPDGGATGTDSASPGGDGYLLWQAPGGWAGHGPALEVLADGTVHLWRATPELTPHQTANWDEEINLTAPKASELFLIFKNMNFAGLPNHTDLAGDCYPIFHLESCSGCVAQEFRDYGSAVNLQPQFRVVYEWLEENLAAQTEIELPSTFCTYALGRIPCGEKTCDQAKEIYVIRQLWAIAYECVAIPQGCEGNTTCSCVGKSVRTDTCDVRGDDPAPQTVTCACINC